MKLKNYEYIFPLGVSSCHASHFVLLDNSEIFAVWFQGSAEGGDDVCIWGALRSDGKWGEPRRLTPDDGQPHWNPVLTRLPDGRVMLMYKVGKLIADWHTEVMFSSDSCRSFTQNQPLIPGDVSGGRGAVRNKVITLSNGRLLAPGSTERGEWKCFTDYSDDGGMSWHRSADICIPREYIEKYKDITGHGIIQPTLWESSPGNVHALLRSSEGLIFRIDSTDNGMSWCKPYPSGLPNNNSGIDIDKVGNSLYLACTPCGNRNNGNWGERSPLCLLRSEDNGNSWSEESVLVSGVGEFSYPALRIADGKIHITYTWDRKTIMYMNFEL